MPARRNSCRLLMPVMCLSFSQQSPASGGSHKMLLTQPRAEAHGVLAEDFPARGFAEARALDGLLHGFRPRGVAVRPVAGEQPHILAQLLDAELDRALPAVDAVEV